MNLRGIVFAVCVGAVAASASAVDVNDIFKNTGQGVSLGSNDLNYSLTYTGSDNVTTDLVANVVNPDGAWVDNTITTPSQWIGPLDRPSGDVSGYYTYTLNVDLAGLDLKTLGGKWSTDDTGEILVNGKHAVGTPDYPYWTHWTDFSIDTSLFNAGQKNTLQFKVANTGDGPTGLRVQFDGKAQIDSVPEPFTMALMIGGAGFAIRRRLKK